ncbi:MAG: propionyl-coenzyme A carboxylase alpha polypeptide [Mesorhizobium sp.]|nr:MAG: propionyl-coenzyme A carboxylase alpha polypeptide [Mesorhizobium sp.]RWA85334.1 MAG: propionyl-coenzyme A carboxylase alpha polypeptide [Mesorhizobium sp.]
MSCVQERPLLAYRPSPPQGGRLAAATLSPIIDVAGRETESKLRISPLEGEMAGRPEGVAR